MSVCRLLKTSALKVVLGVAIPLAGRAQFTQSNLAYNMASNFNNGYGVVPNSYQLLAADGSLIQGRYSLWPAWTPASILLLGNQQAIAAPLKYDIYRQELRVQRPQGDSVIVPLSKVQEFTVKLAAQERRFVCYPAAQLPPGAGGGCGEVLGGGPALQLVKFWRRVAVRRYQRNGSYASNVVENQLEEQAQYFLHWADTKFSPVRLRRSSLVEALAGQPAALQLLAGYKGSLTTEEGMAAAVKQIAALISN